MKKGDWRFEIGDLGWRHSIVGLRTCPRRRMDEPVRCNPRGMGINRHRCMCRNTGRPWPKPWDHPLIEMTHRCAPLTASSASWRRRRWCFGGHAAPHGGSSERANHQVRALRIAEARDGDRHQLFKQLGSLEDVDGRFSPGLVLRVLSRGIDFVTKMAGFFAAERFAHCLRQTTLLRIVYKHRAPGVELHQPQWSAAKLETAKGNDEDVQCLAQASDEVTNRCCPPMPRQAEKPHRVMHLRITQAIDPTGPRVRTSVGDADTDREHAALGDVAWCRTPDALQIRSRCIRDRSRA